MTPGLIGCSAVMGITEAQSEVPFGAVISGKSHLESRGFAKHIEIEEVTSPLRKAILLVFFSTF